MAIKLPDPGNGIPEQKTGNDEWTNMNIVRENFADKSNAASRLVGKLPDNIPSNRDVFAGALSKDALASVASASNQPAGLVRLSGGGNGSEIPEVLNDSILNTFQYHTYTKEAKVQTLIDGYLGQMYIRRTGGSEAFSAWKPISSSTLTYSTVTGTAANVVVGADGILRRSSSSEKYKKILSKFELDEGLYQKAMQVKPVIYRSKAESDPKNWHYMSFLAEELGELDPSLTQWLVKTHDDDGNELDDPIKEAEGINLNAICAVLHATNVYQGKKLKELEQRLTSLEQTDEPAI